MTVVSFKSVAAKMDPVVPALRARHLADMHRWPTADGKPPVPLSCRSMLSRHVHPQKVEARFLFYNTFLVAGFALPVGKIVGTVGGLLGVALAMRWTS